MKIRAMLAKDEDGNVTETIQTKQANVSSLSKTVVMDMTALKVEVAKAIS